MTNIAKDYKPDEILLLGKDESRVLDTQSMLRRMQLRIARVRGEGADDKDFLTRHNYYNREACGRA